MTKAYRVPDHFKTCPLLKQMAIWHNTTPKQWLDGYKMSQEDIDDTMNRIATTPEEDLFVFTAHEGDKMVGFIWAYTNNHQRQTAMIMSLYVEEAFRKKGIAKTLKVALEQACKQAGIKSLQTTVHYNNQAMFALNQSLGYKPGMVTMKNI